MARFPFANRLLLAKIQPTANTDAAPDAATNAILTRNLRHRPFEGNRAKLEHDGPGFGNTPSVHTSIYAMVTFEVDLAGAGTAGDAPAYGPLLRACGLDETIDIGVEVAYTPIDEAQEMVTLHYIHRDELHALTDAMGTFRIVTSREGFPALQFTFMGVQVDPTAYGGGAPDLAAFLRPLPITKANTTTMTVDGLAARLESIDVDLGNDVQFRDVTYQQDVFIRERQGSGSMAIEKPELTDKNFYTLVRAEGAHVVQMIHGPATNQVQLDLRTQLFMGEDGESQGITTTNLTMDLVPTYKGAGDEFALTVR